MKPHSPSHASPHVAILLGTYHGETFLREQLESIATQSHTDWSLWASDDSHEPATRALLNRYRRHWDNGRLHIRGGPQRGFAENFLTLLRAPEIEADYYAFADQDDIWHADKLARAVAALAELPQENPALYTARTRLVDATGAVLGTSPDNRRTPGFGNALVQNIASGNTMLMNAAARRLLCQAQGGEQTGLHDWWSYLLISGCGGRVVFDNTPCLDYRQHAANLIGMRRGWRTVLERLLNVWQGDHRDQVERNLHSLEGCKAWLTPENDRRLEVFHRSRQGHALQRVTGLHKAGVYRQTTLGSLSMHLAAFLNKG